LLQRHSAKVHQTQRQATDASEAEPSESDHQEPFEVTFDIDSITGHAYTKRANDRLNSSKALRCPYPDTRDLTGDDTVKSLVGGRGCAYVFSRGYDLRRHLHATHDVNIPKDTVEGWVRRKKKSTNS
jgi:general transcription factor IIIA